MPLTSVSAAAFSVPSVDEEGVMSLRASCTAAGTRQVSKNGTRSANGRLTE